MLAIIPARGGSKRLPRKNILPFNGRPIISYPIRSALESGLFKKIIVSSDDDEILSIAREYGAYGVKRPSELSEDWSSEIDAYAHVLENEQCDYFCGIYPTAVFLKTSEIKGAFIELMQRKANICMGVTKFNDQHPFQTILQRGNGYYSLWVPELNEQTPYPDAYASNGSLYWFKNEKPLRYFPEKMTVYPTFNIDINNIDDFKKAERVYRECLNQII